MDETIGQNTGVETPDYGETRPVVGTEVFLDTPEKIKAYKKWRTRVNPEFRHIVEARLLGSDVAVSKEESPVLQEFYISFQKLLSDPDFVVDTLEVDAKVKN